jgi:hypothetical protein
MIVLGELTSNTTSQTFPAGFFGLLLVLLILCFLRLRRLIPPDVNSISNCAEQHARLACSIFAEAVCRVPGGVGILLQLRVAISTL